MNKFQLCAADFNNNGIVNNSDALEILRYYTGYIDKIPSNKSDWVFGIVDNLPYYTMVTPPNLCSQDTIQVINTNISVKLKALCTGDVNGSRPLQK